MTAADAPTWTARVDNPYLHGIHGPVVHETTAVDLEVEGELPVDLYGAYVRNGPNQVYEPTNPYHWFDGDGMVHGLYFRDGRLDYRSRFVRTDGLADELRQGRAIWPGVMGPFDFEKPRHYLKDRLSMPQTPGTSGSGRCAVSFSVQTYTRAV